MNDLRNYLRRFNLALKGRDDRRLINRVRTPLVALADELSDQRDRLALQLTARISERDKLAQQLAVCNRECERLAGIVCGQHAPEAVLEATNVVPSRVSAIFTHLQSDRVRHLRSLLKNDVYYSPGATLRRLPHTILDVSTGLVVLPDGSLEESARTVASYYTDTSCDGLAERVRSSVTGFVAPDVIHVFHRSCGAYGHFVLDGLCALALLSDTIRYEGLKVLVPDFLPAWATDALADLGFDESCLVHAAGIVICRNMVLSSTLSMTNCFYPNPTMIAKLRQFAGATTVREPSRRIYLTREGAHSPRFVKNETAVEKKFVDAGFEVVSPASLRFREQIELFSNASVIAGHHGSAFTNIIFAKRGATIIDIMPEHWVYYWGIDGWAERWIFNLTGVCGHNYSLLLSESSMDGESYLRDAPKELPKIVTDVDINLLDDVLSGLAMKL
jgi:hypothetical protein